MGTKLRVCFAAMVSTLARSAGAETHAPAAPVESIHLEYADGVCPERPAFERQLLERTTRVRLVDEGQERTFAVSFTGTPGALTGVLEIRSPSSEVLRREVPGEACEDVVAALALVAALAVDPHASTEPVSYREPPRAVEDKRDEKRDPPPVRAPAAWHAGIGAEVGVRGATLPSTAPGGMVFGQWGLERDVWFSPAVRLALGGTLTKTVSAPVGTSSFRWFGGRAELCPIHARLTRDIDVRPCAGMELGALSAVPDKIPQGRTATRLWLAGSAALRFFWQLAPRGVFLEAGPELSVPFARHRFYLGPDSTVFLVPAVGGGVWFGLGLFFS